MRAVRSAPTSKRIRALVEGKPVVDSQRARIVWFGPVARTYAVPAEDVRGHIGRVGGAFDDVIAGAVPSAPLEVDGRHVPDTVLAPDGATGLDGYVILNWAAMDAWFEEDEEVFVHPHDPKHRIDVRRSSRHVIVELGGERIAESRRPLLLFETHLPPRYYLPPLDVRLDLLQESDTKTACAYKGFARHLHARTPAGRREDVAWTYPASFPEAQPVQGLIAFYQERTDFTLDGERIERPPTPWRRED